MAQTTLRDYLQVTEDAISTGRIDDAMEKCQHILTLFPESLEAQRLLGEVYLAQGQLEEAQQTFDWILANDPENVIVYCDRALISERTDDFDTALDCYQQAYELSRGNSQIRQEFNALSAKVGQQDFMFSRAGLARLYMRGDLLPQAMQEWEVILNASPDRLDARTGLLETYWREGLYDQVEKLAGEILNDIPSCLKALLLLAHVTFVYNMDQARELLQRAEALDPEMAIAQDLFHDLIASQPKDPFVVLLKKGPVIVPESHDGEPVLASMKAEEIASNILSPALASEATDSHLGWADLESWSELDTMSVPQQRAQGIPESSAHAALSSDGVQDLDAWAALGQSFQSKPEVESELEVWEEPQEVERDLELVIADDEASGEEQPWYQAEQVVEQADESIGAWSSVSSPPSSLDPWETESRETDLPTPPAWLDMLTRGDGASSARPTPLPSEQEPPVVSPLSEQTQVEPAPQVQIPTGWDRPTLEPALNTQASPELETEPAREQKEEPAFFFASDDKEEDMGWPEWLKSLGAATMEPEPQQEVAEAFTAVPEPLSQIPSTPWLDALNQEFSGAQALPTNEQQLVTSLEDLEHDLHSQGFIPLEPGSLATIAQEQQEQVPTLSSALAQFGDLPQQPAPITEVFTKEPVQATTPTPSAAPEPVPTFSNTTSAEPASIASSTEPSPSPASGPVPVSGVSSITGPLPVPSYHADALLENELETTMRRPSIRLQPMQQRFPAQQAQPLPGNKGRGGEQGGTGKTSDSSLSYKERLLRGYHAQLDGAYDNAMQEYRIIIRNAPELLGEVISNLRALLKLVPRYTLGYRVLGDAYMRQGEYLQAMEAYNKALTMAKKAKSQGSSG
jgi:tetratricopeptide (TPR) repeat protein